jgi:hypothetical protein
MQKLEIKQLETRGIKICLPEFLVSNCLISIAFNQ